MTTYGACIIGRNDDYGQNLLERATYCLNSMIGYLDEVIFVDWNTDNNKPTLIEELRNDLLPSKNFHWVRVSQEQAKEWTFNNPQAQEVCETQARNVGLRRLSTDFLVSSNIDVIAPQRRHIERITDVNTFYTTGMRSISLYKLRELGSRKYPHEYMPPLEALEAKSVQQPVARVHQNDGYSLVSNCGDFQVAHRNIWYAMRGFEERMVGRAYADSNVQYKAVLFGYKIAVAWDVPIWHIGHEGGYGGSGGVNDVNLAFTMTETTNPETWGHSDIELEVRSL
jgi:hypothetical protein